MNDAIEVIGIGFTVAIIFGVPFAFFAFVRYLRYRETVALADRGLLRPSKVKQNRDSARWGYIFLFLGIAFTLGMLTLGIGPWLLVGFVPFFFGVALIAINNSNDKEPEARNIEDEIEPIPPHKNH